MTWLKRTQTGFWCWPKQKKPASGTLAPKAVVLPSKVPDHSSPQRDFSASKAAAAPVINGRASFEPSNNGNHLAGIELPGDLKHVFAQVGSHLVGSVLTVLGVALGKGAVLQMRFWPTPVNPSLGFAICADQSETIESACQAITQALRDEGDKRLSRIGVGAKAIEQQIEQLEIERQAFFGADIVRDAKVDARFQAQIEGLRALLHSTILVENPRPGTLDLALQKSGGGGLLACFNEAWFSRLLDAAKRDPRDLQIITQAWQGKTPEMGYSKPGKARPIIRPVVSFLLTCKRGTVSRLVCSAEPAVREFTGQLILARAPDANFGCFCDADLHPLPARIEQLVAMRDSGLRRQLRLSCGAASALLAYAKEVEQRQSEPQRWQRTAVVTAAKIGIILCFWKSEAGDEITEKTMCAAIGLTRWLAQESAATACACAAVEQDRAVRQAAAVMLEKLHNSEKPVTRQQLYRLYDNESRALHDPILEFLLRTRQVGWVEGGRLEPIPETSGEANDKANS